MAEEMKKEFFRKTGILRSRFYADSDMQHDSDLNVTAVDRWCLSLVENNQFKEVYDFPNVFSTLKKSIIS